MIINVFKDSLETPFLQGAHRPRDGRLLNRFVLVDAPSRLRLAK